MSGIQDVLAKFPLGVYIVGSAHGDRINGMTAAWVSQVSFSPKMVAVAIAPERYTFDLVRKSGKFSLSLLGEDQLELAKRFGFYSGREENKFSGVDYHLIDGLPVLDDCVAWVSCEVEGSCEAGDHVLFLGRVVKAKLVDDRPVLLFRWEDYF